MMLVEEGKIAIDDPVHRWIPAWRELAVYRSGMPGAFTTRPVDAPMRIVDLLRHTSGLTYGFQLRTSVDAAYRSSKADAFEAESLESFIDTLGRLPLEFSPGTAWNYSVSTDVIGYLTPSSQACLSTSSCARASCARSAWRAIPTSSCPTRRRCALRRLLRQVVSWCARAGAAARVPQAAARALRRGRPGLHRRRLHALLRAAAARRQARRRAPARPEDAGADARQSSARQARPRRALRLDVLGEHLPGRRISAWVWR